MMNYLYCFIYVQPPDNELMDIEIYFEVLSPVPEQTHCKCCMGQSGAFITL